MKKMMRAALAITATVGALALSGCAANPDVSGLEAELAAIEGVNGVMVHTTHSGAPWNTQIRVNFFIDDPADETLIAVVEAAAPVLAEDSASAGREVSLRFVDGDRADYTEPPPGFGDLALISRDVAASLGIAQSGSSESLRLTPDDDRRLAGEQ